MIEWREIREASLQKKVELPHADWVKMMRRRAAMRKDGASFEALLIFVKSFDA